MVHFVGAGSGAEDLITVRGMNHLKAADCVVYAGSLVNPKLLDYCKPETEIFNSALMTLEEVMDILISRSQADKYVVRLHTGDPSLYGAIGEQIRELNRLGIKYDVTPGVSAAFSAAASLCQELTLPGISQSIILTRMEGKTPMPEKESIINFAKIGATMAIYLSASDAAGLKSQLLEGGYNLSTPVAICHKVSWPDEKIYITDVEHMDTVVERENLKLTTLFLVGEVLGANDFLKSRLYASDFTTIFREGV